MFLCWPAAACTGLRVPLDVANNDKYVYTHVRSILLPYYLDFACILDYQVPFFLFSVRQQ